MDLLVKDCGVSTNIRRVDYPDLAVKVVKELKKDKKIDGFGILICKTGAGMTIAANRFTSIRAVFCHSINEAVYARTYNNANILCLGSSVTSINLSLKIVKAFIGTVKSIEERYLSRSRKIDTISFYS